jgi:uncharacterized protein YidB (DUF937 family)
MGLLDIFTGRDSADAGSGRVPPLAKALAGLISYGQVKNGGTGANYADRLEDLFKPSSSGGPTTQGVVGALLTGGMMDLVRQFQGAGKAATVDSWVERGSNKALSAQELSEVMTEEQIAFLTQRTGLSRQELLAGLSERLPLVVDELTPEGRLPTKEELQRRV